MSRPHMLNSRTEFNPPARDAQRNLAQNYVITVHATIGYLTLPACGASITKAIAKAIAKAMEDPEEPPHDHPQHPGANRRAARM